MPTIARVPRKSEERAAEKFLISRYGKEPIYEPFPNEPPDFSIDTTAFEVRRLSELIKDGSGEPLEKVSTPLENSLRLELRNIPFSEQLGSFLCYLKFKRPVPTTGRTAKYLAAEARKHYEGGSRKSKQFDFGSVCLLVVPISPDKKRRAFIGFWITDYDSGGFQEEICQPGTRWSLEDKIKKTKSIANQFHRWVLILVDHAWGSDMEPMDLDCLDLGHFDGLAVIDYDGELKFEYPGRA
jgi:hypothetical protein